MKFKALQWLFLANSKIEVFSVSLSSLCVSDGQLAMFQAVHSDT